MKTKEQKAAYQKEYRATERGKAAMKRYTDSPKGKARMRRGNRSHYLRNKSQVRAENDARREQMRLLQRARVIEFKSRPCFDCHQTFPVCCMDLHHEYGKKKFSIAAFTSYGGSPATLEEELAKCIPLCSHCHRIRHAKDGKNNSRPENRDWEKAS